jgi:hypothetical protein
MPITSSPATRPSWLELIRVRGRPVPYHALTAVCYGTGNSAVTGLQTYCSSGVPASTQVLPRVRPMVARCRIDLLDWVL